MPLTLCAFNKNTKIYVDVREFMKCCLSQVIWSSSDGIYDCAMHDRPMSVFF